MIVRSRLGAFFFGFVLDDIFKSTVHRAINRTGVERYSMPLFFGTDYNVRLEVRLAAFIIFFSLEALKNNIFQSHPK